jgi:hypothetical protein
LKSTGCSCFQNSEEAILGNVIEKPSVILSEYAIEKPNAKLCENTIEKPIVKNTEIKIKE